MGCQHRLFQIEKEVSMTHRARMAKVLGGIVVAALVAACAARQADTAGRPPRGEDAPAARHSDTGGRRAMSVVRTAQYRRPSEQRGAPGHQVAYGSTQQDAPPLFEDWPRPDLALVLTGEQIGFLEPCGCAGLDNQKGGLKRRHALVKQLRRDGWPLAALDLGGQVKRFGQQAVIKYRHALESLVTIGYDAVGFGPQDLRLSTPEMVAVIANLDPQRNPLVSANVDLFQQDSGFVARHRVVRAGNVRVGVTAVVGRSLLEKLNNDDLVLRDPVESLAQVVPDMRASADFLVLLSHAPVEESKRLASRFPEFHLVVTAGGAAEPPPRLVPMPGTRARLAEVGHKGMYVGVVGLFGGERPMIRYQRVPLDARFDKEGSQEMAAMLLAYQRDLETLGLSGLGVEAVPHATSRRFVGSEICGDCHTQAYEVWENTPHAHATETLLELNPQRHHDPECLSCHVTGWNPQQYFPYRSGYLDLATTPHLKENGCENCHGPGADHVAAELGEVDVDEPTLDQLRAAMRLTLAPGEAEGQLVNGRLGKVTAQCYECHDLDNSPDFDFKEYWPHVAHEGTD